MSNKTLERGMRTLMRVLVAKVFFGWSERRACREIAKMPWPKRSPDGEKTGEASYRSWQAVASAVRRARKFPK